MSHPAKQINQTSWQIVNGDYDKAIVSLKNILETLKLILSGDTKILIPNESNEDEEDCMKYSDSSLSSTSSSGSLEYGFFSSSTTSSFLEATVAVKERRSNHCCSRIHGRNNGTTSTCCCDGSDSSVCAAQHQLQVSIFRNPILVNGDHFRTHLDILVCKQLSYVAIYNLGLSHHLKSVELDTLSTTSSSSSNENLQRQYLYKALSLYGHSHQILMKLTTNVGVPFIHSMALVSNLGQIHHALGDYHKTEMCMQYMLSTMMCVIDCGEVDTLGNSMDGFLNMILPLISKEEPAPAA